MTFYKTKIIVTILHNDPVNLNDLLDAYNFLEYDGGQGTVHFEEENVALTKQMAIEECGELGVDPDALGIDDEEQNDSDDDVVEGDEDLLNIEDESLYDEE